MMFGIQNQIQIANVAEMMTARAMLPAWMPASTGRYGVAPMVVCGKEGSARQGAVDLHGAAGHGVPAELGNSPVPAGLAHRGGPLRVPDQLVDLLRQPRLELLRRGLR